MNDFVLFVNETSWIDEFDCVDRPTACIALVSASILTVDDVKTHISYDIDI